MFLWVCGKLWVLIVFDCLIFFVMFKRVFNDFWLFVFWGGFLVYFCKLFYGGDIEFNEKNCNDNNFFMGFFF